MTKNQAEQKALKLIKDMEINDNKIQKTLESYNRNPKSVAFPKKLLKELEILDTKLYNNYYYFMENLFGSIYLQKEMALDYYEKGFRDINFVKHMFKKYEPNLK